MGKPSDYGLIQGARREEEIVQVMAFNWSRYHQRTEPSTAVPLAAVLTGGVVERPAVLIISRGNVQAEQHEKLIRPYTLSQE